MLSGLAITASTTLGYGREGPCLTLGFRGSCSSSLSSCISPEREEVLRLRQQAPFLLRAPVTRILKSPTTGVYTSRPEGWPVRHCWYGIWLELSCMHWDVPSSTLGLLIVQEKVGVRERKKGAGQGHELWTGSHPYPVMVCGTSRNSRTLNSDLGFQIIVKVYFSR